MLICPGNDDFFYVSGVFSFCDGARVLNIQIFFVLKTCFCYF